MIFLEILEAFILSPWFIASVLFWIFVCILIFLLRKKKKSYYLFFPVMALFKTKKLNKYIVNIGKKAPKFWKIFWTIGIFLSFGFMIFSFWIIFSNLFLSIFNLINPPIENGGVSDFNMEFAYWILPLIFLYTTHELSHGIAASAENVDVKSTGIIGLGFLFLIGFGAFVEVDEKELFSTKVSRTTRLRISAAGAHINIITTGIIFLFLTISPYLISPCYTKSSKILRVLTPEEGGFNYGNLTNNDIIYGIKKDGTSKFITLDEFQDTTLDTILSNQTTGINCTVGDVLNVKVYNEDSSTFSEKNITLGPKYETGIAFEYINNSALKIFYNYTSKKYVNIIITEIEGIKIDLTEGNTLEKKLTEINLKTIELTSSDGENYTLNLKLDGVYIGIISKSSFMYKNDLGQFLTNFFPEFITKQLSWFYLLSMGLIIFNLLPLFITDGDRMVKEVINWGIGENFKEKREKKEKIYFRREEKEIELSEYRVEKINSIKIITEDGTQPSIKNEIMLGKNNYTLFDKIGDGFTSTVRLKLTDNSHLEEGALIEIDYEYIHDVKKKNKKIILNTIRIITLLVFIINFVFLFSQFGFSLFGISL